MNSDEILVEEKSLKYKERKENKAVLVQDLLHPTAASEARKHKLKTLVQGPRSYFLDVKCPGCLNITTVFSHAQTAVTCESCSTVLCTPTGGKAKLSEGTSFRRK
ncbi:BTE_HP_G0078300.mRNA.1.CDS.1 [Saccharomyces cerevisiae]|nr:BTE_HP_G0078300.mRNA.1.CDS.1 [Saccharomyces cerevisiae]CAI6940920.1 BTE_HP_G0078300.mRNA.1.CDS.1 [Saccharomyces cerevisiae]